MFYFFLFLQATIPISTILSLYKVVGPDMSGMGFFKQKKPSMTKTLPRLKIQNIRMQMAKPYDRFHILNFCQFNVFN